MSQASKSAKFNPAPQTGKRRMRTGPMADYLNISSSTLAKGRMTGNGPPYTKVGRIVVYDLSDVDEWLASRRRRSTSEYS